MTNSFTNGIGNSVNGMFGGLGNFGESNLYDQNKENVKELSMWAMTYGDEKSTRDVMVQTDLGEERRLNCIFLKCMWIIFIKVLVQKLERDLSS